MSRSLPRTTLFHADAIRTSTGAIGDTLAETDGVVTAVGDWLSLRGAYPDAQVVDFEDSVITPGLIDGHAHPVWGTMMTRGVSLVDCENYDQVVAALRAEGARTSASEWVFAWGLEAHMIGGSVTNDVIHDALGPERRVYVTSFDAHSAVLSASALTDAGVVAPEEMSDGGGFTAREDGSLTGHVLEFMAMKKVESAVPEIAVEVMADKLSALLEEFAATGITGVYVPDAQGGELVVAVLEELEHRGELPVKLRISPWCTPDLSADDVRDLASRMRPDRAPHGRRWRFEGVKMFIDGTIDNGTAWLDIPDTMGDGDRGFWQDPATYTRNLRIFNEAGVPTITHAIGEAGVRHVALAIADLPDTGTLHRIDHLETVSAETIDVIAENRIPVCVQPTHCTLFVRADGEDAWSQRLGKERRAQGYKVRTFVDHGILEALGSDWPVAPYDPRGIMADSQLRHRHDGGEVPFAGEEVLTAEQALAGYTANVPASVGLSGNDLRLGEACDLTVWGADPVATSAEELPKVAVRATIVDGVLVNEKRS